MLAALGSVFKGNWWSGDNSSRSCMGGSVHALSKASTSSVEPVVNDTMGTKAAPVLSAQHVPDVKLITIDSPVESLKLGARRDQVLDLVLSLATIMESSSLMSDKIRQFNQMIPTLREALASVNRLTGLQGTDKAVQMLVQNKAEAALSKAEGDRQLAVSVYLKVQMDAVVGRRFMQNYQPSSGLEAVRSRLLSPSVTLSEQEAGMRQLSWAINDIRSGIASSDLGISEDDALPFIEQIEDLILDVAESALSNLAMPEAIDQWQILKSIAEMARELYYTRAESAAQLSPESELSLYSKGAAFADMVGVAQSHIRTDGRWGISQVRLMDNENQIPNAIARFDRMTSATYANADREFYSLGLTLSTYSEQYKEELSPALAERFITAAYSLMKRALHAASTPEKKRDLLLLTINLVGPLMYRIE